MCMNPIRVLTVDDDPWVIRGLASALESEPGIGTVVGTEDPTTAVDLFEKHAPDIVLVDLSMPRMNGVDVITALMRRDSRAKILVLTSLLPGPNLTRALEAGALGVVHKTTPGADLAAALVRTVDHGVPPFPAQLLKDIRHSTGGVPLPGSPRLTDRQRATLEAIGRGWDIGETAERLGVARSTVESHLKELRVKLGATSLSTLILQGYRHGFIEIPR